MSPLNAFCGPSVKRVVNRRQRDDVSWVVGWFPRLFEIWPFTLLGNDIGSAGFNGFTKPDKMSASTWENLGRTFLFQTNFVEGGHGTAIEPKADKIDSMAAFVMDATPTVLKPKVVLERQEWFYNITSITAPGIWLVILGLLTGGWVAVGRFPE